MVIAESLLLSFSSCSASYILSALKAMAWNLLERTPSKHFKARDEAFEALKNELGLVSGQI
jgi:hypothetical protein